MKTTMDKLSILTIGHSTREIGTFIGLLKSHGVTLLVDVRTVPRSRKNPQFNWETLPDALQAVGIGYLHLPRLGGLRRPRPDSLNAGWRNESFRGYADYMGTPEFRESLERLTGLAQERVAVMCAEAVLWRCHRSLMIADALTVRGIPVEHIMSASRAQSHTLTPFSQVHGAEIIYPPTDESPDDG
jgi:uncharacterized protein (DUF488 family)